MYILKKVSNLYTYIHTYIYIYGRSLKINNTYICMYIHFLTSKNFFGDLVNQMYIHLSIEFQQLLYLKSVIFQIHLNILFIKPNLNAFIHEHYLNFLHCLYSTMNATLFSKHLFFVYILFSFVFFPILLDLFFIFLFTAALNICISLCTFLFNIHLQYFS